MGEETPWCKSYLVCDQEFALPQQVAELGPFNDAATLVFEADYRNPYENGRLSVNLHLNADLSVSVSWEAQLRNGAEVENSENGLGSVAPLVIESWTGLWMKHSTAFSDHQVWMDWTIENALAPA